MTKDRGGLGPAIDPTAVTGGESVVDLIEGTFFAYNAARLREGCRLFAEKMLEPDVTVGLSITGALTPAGLGTSCLIPLIRAGFVDWIVTTGANLYHDTHYGIGLSMHRGTPAAPDAELREEGVVRIYDIFFDYDVLLKTDEFFRQMITAEEFQRPMSTSEFHYLAGKYVAEREKALGLVDKSFFAEAWRCGVPLYTSSPGDSSIGTGIVYDAKRSGGKSAILILGGGSPKNFMLQTEPQIQEVLGLDEKGHDYFMQFTDARPDTGGLSGATPSEAVTWGKVDPDRLPDAVVCYLDTTVALPILTSYAMAKREPREVKRLYDRREELLGRIRDDYLAK
jgi:deoxyhypusine synthase